MLSEDYAKLKKLQERLNKGRRGQESEDASGSKTRKSATVAKSKISASVTTSKKTPAQPTQVGHLFVV